MFNNLGNLADLMRNAGKIQESMRKATESLGQLEVEGSAGGGVVQARANGRLELTALKIDPKKENMSPLGRPIKIVDGGVAVKELFA